MKLTIEVERINDIHDICHHLANAAQYTRVQADKWVHKFGEKGDAVDISLHHTAEMLEGVVKSLAKQSRQIKAAADTAQGDHKPSAPESS